MASVSTSRFTSTTDTEALQRVVELACRAPSVHNTQPWRWRVTGTRVELHADWSRQLEVSDPDGRNLMISCGGALHHLQVAAEGLGWVPTVTRFPAGHDPALLAVIELGSGAPVAPDRVELLHALESRQTDRRRFTTWPVPEERVASLASVNHRWGARVLPLTGVAARAIVERLIDRALEHQSHDARYLAEQRAWTDRSAVDGLSSAALSPREQRDRFQRVVRSASPVKPVHASDQVLAICTARDDHAAWLDAGETLSAIWLRAVNAGFSLVPLSQVIEVDETRQALMDEVFYGMARPQLLARVGWQEVSRAMLKMTPRRPLSDVLDLATREEAGPLK